ncbi:hypothetical protein Q8A67_025511 [Cirrhinus molitorella]|uniref:Uncharacterized protein n=1 Tax=Cirrhinus molitorella TaxID=172907 RepID=A0AA88P0P1_9TELE|nr:hypothetical protein Q8A67_025511 [Cirrhinus molitorella]
MAQSFRRPYNNPALRSFGSADSRSARCYGGNLTCGESSKLYGEPAFSTSGLIRNLKNVSEEGLRLSIGRCRCYLFPHPLSQLLVTALRSIPANYPHEFPRTKTALCERSEARPPPPPWRRTRAVLRPGMGGGDGRARHFGSAVSPYLASSQLEDRGEFERRSQLPSLERTEIMRPYVENGVR